MPVDESSQEMKSLLSYVKTLVGLIAFRTEWCIFGDEERLAGSIDFVAENADHELVIFDWKRSRGLPEKYSNRWQKMRTPLCHLDDAQGIHYRLQLNIYKYLLQNYYGKSVIAMRVVCTHPEHDAHPFVDEVPDMQLEVEAMMEVQRRRVLESQAMYENDVPDPMGGMMSEDDMDFSQQVRMEEAAEHPEAIGEVPEMVSLDEPWTTDRDFGEHLETLLGDRGFGESARGSSASNGHHSSRAGVSGANAAEAGHAEPMHGAEPEGGASQQIQESMGGADLPMPMEPGEQVDLEFAPEPGADANQKIIACKRRRAMRGAATSLADFGSLFMHCEDSVTNSLRGVNKNEAVRSTTILQRVATLRLLVDSSYPAWDDRLKTLGIAALAIYRLRLVDMFLREHVLLLWVIDGERYIRVHKGICYLYHEDGAFQPYRGIPPEETFARVKEYLLHLEGVFRLLPLDLRRDDTSLLLAIANLHTQHGSTASLLDACTDAAIFNLGDKGARKGLGKGYHHGAGIDDGAAAPTHWNIYTA